VLRSFVTEAPGKDFSHLPIPFRCVATDLETGKPVVIDHGDLENAMRASMSCRARFRPRRSTGTSCSTAAWCATCPSTCADMGREVIIAVNLGSPLLKKEDLGNVLGVSLQMINILTQQNVGPVPVRTQARDVLISPDLTGFNSTSFDQARRSSARRGRGR